MTKKLYRLMNWARIEGIVYQDDPHPEELLGPHIMQNQTLIQAFFPNADKVAVVLVRSGETIPMEKADDAGFYAVLIPGKIRDGYQYEVTATDVSGKKRTTAVEDPYRFPVIFDDKALCTMKKGIHYHTYEILGAHECMMDQVRGTRFAVWAPDAGSVSIAGDFNHFDASAHQMSLIPDSGIFALFIPGVGAGALYQYEIRCKGSMTLLKSDPYAQKLVQQEGRYQIACVPKQKVYQFHDQKWMQSRALSTGREPVNILEMTSEHVFKEFYRDKMQLVAGLTSRHITHLEITKLVYANEENPYIEEPLAFYALHEAIREKQDLQELSDLLHQAGIGLVLAFNPAVFSGAKELLGFYDGECIYEAADERQGYHNRYGVKLFKYGRPEVTDFLISNLNYLTEQYHADGIRWCNTSFMLYLDYDKQPREWIPNMYGGNENLEAIEFIKHANSILHKLHPEVLSITDEHTGWQNMTVPLVEDGLGFDYKWNYGFLSDALHYLAIDPIERSRFHQDITMSYIYAFYEHYILSLSKDYLSKLDADSTSPFQNPDHDRRKRLLTSYMLVHPGKKLFQEELTPLGDTYYDELNSFYRNNPALYEEDESPEGFEWINQIDANECVLVFLRKAATQTLLVAVNFAGINWENRKTGVPFAGKYREIWNTDSTQFDGEGYVNSRLLRTKAEECDARPDSIRLNLAPLSVSVYEFVPYTDEELKQMRQKDLEKQKKKEEAQLKKELLRKEKERIRASLKEELAQKIAMAEEAIAAGSEFAAEEAEVNNTGEKKEEMGTKVKNGRGRKGKKK